MLNPYLPLLGGGEKYMGHMCKFLEDRYPNACLDILIHDNDHTKLDNKPIPALNRRFGLRLSRTSTRMVKFVKELTPWEWFQNKFAVEKIAKEYDLFINNMFLSRHDGKARKNIYICLFPPKPSTPEIDRLFVTSYDKFVAISNFTARWMKKYLNGIRESVVVYPPAFSEEGSADRYEEDRKENIILAVGRFFVRFNNKKQLEMVRLYLNNKKKLKDYELHLAGALSENSMDAAYVNQIRSMIKNERIYLHINIPFNDLIDLYRKAKVLWHATGLNEDADDTPEKMEHFGITTVEAMSYGAVPVVINKGGQREIVETGKNGFLWDNESDCIDHTVNLISHQALRLSMARAASLRSREFSTERFYEALKAVFDGM